MNETNLTPQQYFDEIKGRKQKCTDEMLNTVYENCMELLNKYKITGQKNAMKKLIFHLSKIEEERKLLALGIDTFVYKSDIQDYILSVNDRVVKICDLADYEREIPDEIVETIQKCEGIFDNLYVVYTDYTGETERKVSLEKKAKDPILFGAFINRQEAAIVERFYYLGDWVDAYCDLTLDKMVSETSRRTGTNIKRTIKTPQDIKELQSQLNDLKPVGESYYKIGNQKENIITKVFSAVRGK